MVFLFAMMALYSDGPMARGLHALNYPFQLDNVEGYLLDEAVELSHGRSIYRPIDEEPYLVGNYPPFYQAVLAVLVRLGEPSLFFGRLLALTSAMGITLCLLILAYRCGGQILPSLLAPFLFLVTFEVHSWIAYARVDLPSIFLALLGLVCFVAEDTRTARWTSALFFALAIFTKQTAIAAPAACCIFLFFRNWRQGLRYALLLALLLAIPTAILTALTHGQYWLHTVTYNANEMNWDQVRDFWLPHLQRFYAILGAGLGLGLVYVLVIAIGRLFQRHRPETAAAPPQHDFTLLQQLLIATVYFLLTLMMIPALAKAGSAENYLLEPLAGAALFYSAVIGFATSRSAAVRRPYFSRAAAILLLGFLFAHADFLVRGQVNGMRTVQVLFSRQVPRSYEAGKMLLGEVYRSNGEVLAEDPIFLTLSDRRPPINPFILSQLAREKKWDQSQFLSHINERRYSLVVTTCNFNEGEHFARYTDEMADAFRRNYVLAGQQSMGMGAQTYFIYRPVQRRMRVRNVVNAAEARPMT